MAEKAAITDAKVVKKENRCKLAGMALMLPGMHPRDTEFSHSSLLHMVSRKLCLVFCFVDPRDTETVRLHSIIYTCHVQGHTAICQISMCTAKKKSAEVSGATGVDNRWEWERRDCPLPPHSKLACAVCHRWFRDSRLLEVHIVAHAKRYTYLCLACKKAFGRESKVLAHAAVRHPENRVPASDCHV